MTLDILSFRLLYFHKSVQYIPFDSELSDSTLISLSGIANMLRLQFLSIHDMDHLSFCRYC